jgi:toxin ParE1/3/4
VTHQVRILHRAEADLREIRDYIARDDPSAAGRLFDKLLDAVAALAMSAERGARPRDDRLRRLDYRYLVVDPYIVFYKVAARTVLVYRVLHGHRAYGGLL